MIELESFYSVCQGCSQPLAYEQPVYEVRFGFVYISDQHGERRGDFQEDSRTGLFHGQCLRLPERQNECCSGGGA